MSRRRTLIGLSIAIVGIATALTLDISAGAKPMRGTTANALRDFCRFSKTKSAYIEPGSPWQNAYVESFGSRIRDELLAVEQFSCLAEAKVMVEDWREDYNERRPHSALAMMAPAKFARAWRRALAEGKVIPFADLAKALRSIERAPVSLPMGENRPEPAARAHRDDTAALLPIALRAPSSKRRHPYPSHQQQPPALTAGWTDERGPASVGPPYP